MQSIKPVTTIDQVDIKTNKLTQNEDINKDQYISRNQKSFTWKSSAILQIIDCSGIYIASKLLLTQKTAEGNGRTILSDYAMSCCEDDSNKYFKQQQFRKPKQLDQILILIYK